MQASRTAQKANAKEELGCIEDFHQQMICNDQGIRVGDVYIGIFVVRGRELTFLQCHTGSLSRGLFVKIELKWTSLGGNVNQHRPYKTALHPEDSMEDAWLRRVSNLKRGFSNLSGLGMASRRRLSFCYDVIREDSGN